MGMKGPSGGREFEYEARISAMTFFFVVRGGMKRVCVGDRRNSSYCVLYTELSAMALKLDLIV